MFWDSWMGSVRQWFHTSCDCTYVSSIRSWYSDQTWTEYPYVKSLALLLISIISIRLIGTNYHWLERKWTSLRIRILLKIWPEYANSLTRPETLTLYYYGTTNVSVALSTHIITGLAVNYNHFCYHENNPCQYAHKDQVDYYRWKDNKLRILKKGFNSEDYDDLDENLNSEFKKSNELLIGMRSEVLFKFYRNDRNLKTMRSLVMFCSYKDHKEVDIENVISNLSWIVNRLGIIRKVGFFADYDPLINFMIDTLVYIWRKEGIDPSQVVDDPSLSSTDIASDPDDLRMIAVKKLNLKSWYDAQNTDTNEDDQDTIDS